MKSNSDFLNKNITFTNKKLANINLKINSLKANERIYDSASSTNLKIRIELIVLEPYDDNNNNNFKDNLKLVINNNNQIREIPYEIVDTSNYIFEKNVDKGLYKMAHSLNNFGNANYNINKNPNSGSNSYDNNNNNNFGNKVQRKNVIKL